MKGSAIAIVGMAGRFPGAHNLDEFWQNLSGGVESIRSLNDHELLAAGASQDELLNPDYIKAAAILDGFDLFDASFFGFSPRDAAIMDPQQRVFLECAWEALEHSGHTPEGFAGSIGVFAGSGMNAYMIYNLLRNHRLLQSAGVFLIRQTGNDKDVLATRVSYQLNLQGPSMSVQTACSTSLVAVHVACQSLVNYECDMALAGGVTIEIPHARGYVYHEGEILSRDGHCRPFDARSSGTVFSSGAGLVVLRRLEDALTDRDTIHAVILGSAVNNDGARKVGYLAPSVEGQAEVIAEALGVAGASPDSISYIETHGTGTVVGDPIEVKGLTEAFRRSTQRKGFCAIGSLKSNIGHLDTAAGVAGLIKAVLALKHKQLPPSLNFESPNPLINFESSPFYVNGSLAEWPDGGAPRRAGVTSLGVGGTNAHVVLEEAPEPVAVASSSRKQLIVISARTTTALDNATSRLAKHLAAHPELNLEDIAHSLQIGRRHFAHRRALIASGVEQAAHALTSPAANGFFSAFAPPTTPSVAFMFSGQGSQYPGMGRDLYKSEPVFKNAIDECAEQLRVHLGIDLRSLLYPTPESTADAALQLNQTLITQPALFSIEFALARWWMEHGIQPAAMVGHSIGEYVAACIAGVFSLRDALAITAMRGHLMQKMDPGAMLAVSLSAGELVLPSSLSLAAVNAPEQCVASGPIEEIEALEKSLTARDIFCRRLQTSHAFHSAMMDPILDDFNDFLRTVELNPPSIPYVSNLTGDWISPEQATDPDFWTRHLRNTVRFSDCLNRLSAQNNPLLLEVGPGQTLASVARQQVVQSNKVFSTLRHRAEQIEDSVFLLNSLAQLWVSGAKPNWSALHVDEDVGQIPLPTYPFERERFWIEPDTTQSVIVSAEPPTGATAVTVASAQTNTTDHWFYRRAWSRRPLPLLPSPAPECWMLFMDPAGVARQVSTQLQGNDQQVIEVVQGSSFKRLGKHRYAVRPGVRADYDSLLSEVSTREGTPRRILHFWSVREQEDRASLDEKLNLSFYSLLFLLQAVGDQDLTGIDLAIISHRLQSVTDERITDPTFATMFGLAKVIPKEFPGILCRCIDIDLASQDTSQIAVQIISEHSSPYSDPTVAYRADLRWTEGLERTDLSASGNQSRLKKGGVYLITGGSGALGLLIAERLAHDFKARLVLLARTPLPPANEWISLIERSGTPSKIKQQLISLRAIEALGSEIFTVTADVANRSQLKLALEQIRERFGSIDGVIHAAGVVEDAPLQIKSRESATRVLAPKVQGTLILGELLRNSPLDFFVLFSSISSVLPPAGQVDYAAANSFLDAFALSRHDPSVIAINWGPWQDTGMTARTSTVHPLIERQLARSDTETAFSSQLSVHNYWQLSEHRMPEGAGILPGTAYLEMVAAALTPRSAFQGVEFVSVFFLSPLLLFPGETREARTHLRKFGKGNFQFSVSSRDNGWSEHATGQVSEIASSSSTPRNLSAVYERCQERTITFDNTHRTRQERFFYFGPRWQSLKAIHVGLNEAVATLDLPAEFATDSLTYLMHPALLDLATGASLYLIEGYEQCSATYFPLSYKKLRLYRPLPARLHSHINSRQRNNAAREVVTFDIVLLDDHGEVLAEIEGFSLRRVWDPASVLSASHPHVPSRSALQMDSAEKPLKDSIPPHEGAGVLLRILSSGEHGNIIVSPDNLSGRAIDLPALTKRPARSEISKDAIEETLADWWQELLGLEHIALDDDFFHLGAHSLIMVRLLSKVKKTYGLELGLSIMFEARTVRQLAQLIRQSNAPAVNGSKVQFPLVAIQSTGTRLPLYVISGLAGNVIKFHSMAHHLGEDQPVYGLLPRGIDGEEPFFTRLEDIASYYVEAIRKLQPDGPYSFVGYSFGGIVAFEVARQIVAQGGLVGLLGMFDTIEWHYMERVDKSLRVRDRFALKKAHLDEMPSGRNRLAYIRRLFASRSTRIAYNLYTALGKPVPQNLGNIEDLNSYAASKYHPGIYPGTITLFRSTARELSDGEDELLGWASFAAGGVEVHDIPSNHFNILQEPAVKVLAEKLTRYLNREALQPAKENLVLTRT